MLRFAEEITLLLLNDDNGSFVHVPEWALKYALAGGVLMDLALEDRIDTDLEKVDSGRCYACRRYFTRSDSGRDRSGRGVQRPFLA